MRRNTASMVLDCNAAGCTLTLQTPYKFLPRNSNTGIPTKTKKRSKRKTKIELQKDQLVRADNIKWNPSSQEIIENYGMHSPTYKNDDADEGDGKRSNKPWNKKNKKTNKKYKKANSIYRNNGPDRDGNYESYVIVLRDPLPPPDEDQVEFGDAEESPSMKMARKMAAQHNSMEHDPNSLASLLEPFAVSNDGGSNTEYMVHLRDFNLGQTRRLARTAVSKINAYSKGRRSSCILRESRPVAWQGLVLLILGIFSFVLCLLLGQFWEEYDPTKVGSYRKRMAEIRKREEAKKQRLRKTASRKPPLKRPGGSQPSLRRPASTGSRSAVSRTVSTGASTVRSRPNAGGTSAKNVGDSWVGGVGGVAQGYNKRASEGAKRAD